MEVHSFTEVVNTDTKQKVMLAFLGYSSVMLLDMKAWHDNVFFKLKHENQILSKS